MARIVLDGIGNMSRSHRSNLHAHLRAALMLAATIVAAAGDASAQSVRLDKMVVVGDSVLAGFASGGLIRKGRMGQRDSAPALIAHQAAPSSRCRT
jgi:hypothetical protein